MTHNDDDRYTTCYNCGTLMHMDDGYRIYIYSDEPDIPEYVCSKECLDELDAALEKLPE